MAEKFFWADKVADDLINQKGEKKEYVCASGITPSGQIHIGNFREVITTDLVVRALRDKGKKVNFIYSWDDYDRFRKVPQSISKEFEEYIGMPLSEIPSPSGKGSYAQFFEKEFEKSLEKVGIKPNFIRQSIKNKNSKYAELIKLAIDKKEEIREILNKYRKEPLKEEWIPLTVYCEKCKKDSTKITSIRGYEVEYECKCGFKNKIDFRKKGIVKAPWRVDWPIRWFYEKVDFEPGGIDHSVAGGSFMTGKEISKRIFDYPAPMYVFYDWVRIKGGIEFSSSKGNVLTLDEVEEIYEPEVLRYLFVGTKPKTGFQISFDNDVIKIYEDYDSLERKYYKGNVSNWEKRIYEMCQIKLKDKKPEKKSFKHLITLVQIRKVEEKDKVRGEKVRNWLEKYASEDMKFEIKNKISFKLNKKEKNALIELKELLKHQKLDEEELFNGFYEICKNIDMENKDFFETAYKVIIGKKKGPRLANLILFAGKEKIVKLLEEIK